MPTPRVSLIVAVDLHNAIGRDNKLPFNVPEDLAHFKKVTTGHAVIMGRKTYESIGKALPNRTNIVVTRNMDYQCDDNVMLAYSLAQAMQLAAGHQEIFIIGGGEIYTQAWAFADQIYLTRIAVTIQEPDTFFPDIIASGEWVAIERITWDQEYGSIWQHSKKDGTPYQISRYLRSSMKNIMHGVQDQSSRKGK